jgi:hypothetical protein
VIGGGCRGRIGEGMERSGQRERRVRERKKPEFIFVETATKIKKKRKANWGSRLLKTSQGGSRRVVNSEREKEREDRNFFVFASRAC